MGTADDELQIRLAARIADQAAIDWQAELAAHPQHKEQIERLRRAEQIAMALRSHEAEYEELRELGRALMATMPPGASLDPATLVRKAHAQLVQPNDLATSHRFYSTVAQSVRRLVLEQAQREAAEQGGAESGVKTPAEEPRIEFPADNIVGLDAALDQLHAVDARTADVVMLRAFAGLTSADTAQVLGLAAADVERHWRFARTVLYDEVGQGVGAGAGGPRLTAESFSQVESLFHVLFEITPAKRERILTKESRHDSEARAIVERLLQHHDHGMGAFLESSGGDAADSENPTDLPEVHKPNGGSLGRVGAYRLLEVVGHGGMGVVYKAEQEQPFRRTVALKIIRLGMNSREVIARFEAERQALALMKHAHIAPVHSAGSAEDGRPYFVMEYVPGLPITEFCDRERLSIRERIDLLMSVLQAIQHAHQKGIIHRDLKPSNVLVMVEGNQPVPKVIDFGIAKAMTRGLTDETLVTQLGEMIGTPEYMSPEQAAMTGQDVDTRTDVYALGVILYELLAGALPFTPTDLRKAGVEGMLRTIREQDPPRPSDRVAGLGDRLPDVARARCTAPAKLAGQLRGDLDWITMKALDKDRARRYGSPSDLEADLRRHMRHEPVVAGPPSARYRAGKFVRRHRIGMVTGSVMAVSLLLATIVSMRFALREAEQRAVAATERDVARAVNEFLNADLLAAVAPSSKEGKGKDVLMRDVLDEAAKRIEEAAAPGGKFEDKPVVEAAIRTTLGETYEKLGEYAAAEPHLKRARDIRLTELGEKHPETLRSANSLAVLYMQQGRYEEAEPVMLRTLSTRRDVLGDEDPSTLDTAAHLAALYRHQARYDEAEPLLLQLLETRTRVQGAEHPKTLDTMSLLASLYDEGQGRYGEAESLRVKTLEIQKRVLGEEHPSTIGTTVNLGSMYEELGRYADAEPLYMSAHEVSKRVLGEEHPRTLLLTNNLANLNARQGRYEQAEPLYLTALEISKRVLGEDHPQTLVTMGNLANMYEAQGRYDEVEPLSRRTLALTEQVLGPEHPRTLIAMINLGVFLHSQGRYEEADALQSQAVAGSRRVWPDGNQYAGMFLGFYGATLIELKRFEEAEQVVTEAREMLSKTLGPNHALVTEQTASLVKLYEAWGKREKASEWQAKLPSAQESVSSGAQEPQDHEE